MNFFKKIFSAKNETGKDNILTTGNNDENFEKMFKDDNAPDTQVMESLNANPLKTFTELNHFNTGLNDGYNFHNAPGLNNGIQKIRSEFQFLLRAKSEELETEIYTLESQLIDDEDMFDNISRQLELRISKIKEAIDNCNKELELSDDLRGMIEFPINSYKDGYEKGMKIYVKEELICKSTGMFG